MAGAVLWVCKAMIWYFTTNMAVTLIAHVVLWRTWNQSNMTAVDRAEIYAFGLWLATPTLLFFIVYVPIGFLLDGITIWIERRRMVKWRRERGYL